jgi:hypothetical protein
MLLSCDSKKVEAGVDEMQAFKMLYSVHLPFHYSLPCCEHESYLFSARQHKMSKNKHTCCPQLISTGSERQLLLGTSQIDHDFIIQQVSESNRVEFRTSRYRVHFHWQTDIAVFGTRRSNNDSDFTTVIIPLAGAVTVLQLL